MSNTLVFRFILCYGTFGYMCALPSVLWHCWLGIWKSDRSVKNEWWGAGVVISLQEGANDLHIYQCQCQSMSISMSIAIFSEAQIVRLLQSPRKRAWWEHKCHNKIRGNNLRKKMSWAVDGMRGWLNVQWHGIPENGCCYGKRAMFHSRPTE